MTPTLMSKAALLMDRLLDAQESPLHEYGEPCRCDTVRNDLGTVLL
jgi:hypothetical protein